MTQRRALQRGFFSLAAGQVAVQGLQFARNLIVVRLISREDFGIAATFAMTISLFQTVTEMSVETLVIQSPDGDKPAFMRTVHLTQFLRGVVVAGLLFLLAAPMASLFGLPEAAWAFHWLPVIPLMKGFMNLGCRQAERHLSFKASIAVDASSQLISLLAAIPLCLYFRDYSAMLWALIIQTAALVGFSHVFGSTSYRWGIDRQILRRIFSFGLPLALNAILFYFINQGDTLVIAAETVFPHFTKVDLATYSAAVLLATAPTEAVWMVLGRLSLPFLSRSQDSTQAYARQFYKWVDAVALVAALGAVIYETCGERTVTLAYGLKYQSAGVLVAWLGVAQCIRLCRRMITVASLAQGDSISTLYSNVVRAVGFGATVLVAFIGAPIVWIAIGAFVAEFMAAGQIALRTQNHHQIPLSPCLRSFAWFFFAIGTAAFISSWEPIRTRWWIFTPLTLLLLAALLISSPFVKEFFKDRRLQKNGVPPVEQLDHVS